MVASAVRRVAVLAALLAALLAAAPPAGAQRGEDELMLPALGISAPRFDSRVLYPALAAAAAQIHAETAWDTGLSGAGQSIAVIDTGVDASHPMLAGRVSAEACFTAATGCPGGTAEAVGAGAAAPCAGVGCGHGTAVASIAAGAPDGGRRGIAFGADVVAVQVFTAGPTGPTTTISEVLRALDWLYAQRVALRLSVVNISIASRETYSAPCEDAPIVAAVGRFATAGIPVVIAAGNGSSVERLSFPACTGGAVSVGAVTAQTAAAPFSNRAAALSFFAPGVAVTAAAPASGSQTQSGTSMAAPQVAGALALLRERSPVQSLSARLRLLDRTGDIVSDGRGSARAAMIRLDRALDPRFAGVGEDSSVGLDVVVEQITPAPGGVLVRGWALDRGSVLAAVVRVDVDGAVAIEAPAEIARPDLAARAPHHGDRHGFELIVPLRGPQTRQVCLQARGPRESALTQVACATVQPLTGTPFGSFDLVGFAPGGLVAQGWAIDPDQRDAAELHVYVDGALVRGAIADRARADVGAVYPIYGSAHGFDVAMAVSPGPHTVCVYAINVGVGSNALVGCRAIGAAVPFGALDAVRRNGSDVVLEGWALDPRRFEATQVHVYVDGVLRAGAVADRERSDVGRVYPRYGAARGYELAVSAGRGSTVCLYALGAVTNALVACRIV